MNDIQKIATYIPVSADFTREVEEMQAIRADEQELEMYALAQLLDSAPFLKEFRK